MICTLCGEDTPCQTQGEIPIGEIELLGFPPELAQAYSSFCFQCILQFLEDNDYNYAGNNIEEICNACRSCYSLEEKIMDFYYPKIIQKYPQKTA